LNSFLHSGSSRFEKKLKKSFWAVMGWWMGSERSESIRPKNFSSVLLLRPDRLGDFILSASAIEALRKKMGTRTRFTLVAGERNETIARFLFPKAKVLVFRRSLLQRFFIFLRLILGRYDAVLDFHSYPFSTTSAVMALLSGSPWRVGFWDGGGSKALSQRVFNLGMPPPALFLHEREKSFRLAGKLSPELRRSRRPLELPPVPTAVRESVWAFYKNHGIDRGTRVVALHPTLQKKDNRWSQSRYLELIERLQDIPNLRIVVTHGRGEAKELERFQAALGSRPRVFVLPKNELLFILEAAKRFDLFVGGDSGLTHLVALVTRVFGIFGPSDPRQWGPLEVGKGKPGIFRKKDKLCDSVSASEVAREIKRALTASRR
jgi:ADP-heptose:LPS heptosyltransferase